MVNNKDIYINYRLAKGYRLPKDISAAISRLSEKNQEALDIAAKYFSTKWHNIDISIFMKCGFEIIPKFSYTDIFNTKVMRYYIQRDKEKKWHTKMSKENIVNSLKFVKNYNKNNNIKNVMHYCNMYDNGKKIIVDHYMKNKVCKYFILWLYLIDYLNIDDEDMKFLPDILSHQNELVNELKTIKDFLLKLKKKL